MTRFTVFFRRLRYDRIIIIAACFGFQVMIVRVFGPWLVLGAYVLGAVLLNLLFCLAAAKERDRHDAALCQR